jgi:hypothetical protein
VGEGRGYGVGGGTGRDTGLFIVTETNKKRHLP